MKTNELTADMLASLKAMVRIVEACEGLEAAELAAVDHAKAVIETANGALDKRTVKELKDECKAKGLRGYSTLKKAELVALLNGKLSVTTAAKCGVGKTVKALKDDCKARGIKKYSTWNKAKLSQVIADYDMAHAGEVKAAA
jgi:NAD(P)H-flavin reductase